MTIVIQVKCEDQEHRLEFLPNGTVHMLDHEENDLVSKTTKIGCLEALKKARLGPAEFLLERVQADRRVLGIASCCFAEHVLPIWEEFYPDDYRPRKAIQGISAYLETSHLTKTDLSILDTSWSDVLDVSKSEAEAWMKGSAKGWQGQYQAAWLVARAARFATWAVAEAWSTRAMVRMAQTAVDAVLAATHDAASRRLNQEAAKNAERQWQLCRALQVLEAV
jgi:hypothetical protein